ncbi:O-antigen ligase family protein [Aurantiacibacter aquimixticola]|uniref:O-antigen ligase domain-containing protein n=1 Tax=Aurantiacibacter aquimixticola TaxID=1958945 RepID=A0A419RUI8_9SPHN|nr:O-antigen ligase family protein [Aurantiacibacter aquimixticola]RJY09442.1 O-antigen ligase domain-containing protein [Aurantiacibacter aquimixticola]
MMERIGDTQSSDSVKSAVRFLSSPLMQLGVLIAAAVLLGGGGVAYGLRNGLVQLLSLGILAANRRAATSFVKRAPRMLVILVLLSLALPLAQLVPLPPSVWEAAPGREPISRSLDVLGKEAWLPLSLDPMRTLVAFSGMIAPATIIIVGRELGIQDRERLVILLAAAACFTFLLGAAQLTQANSAAMLYPITPNADALYGAFANRNSTGLFFLLAGLLLIGSAPIRSAVLLTVYVVAGSLLALGVVLTQSRSSMALLGVVLIFAAFRASVEWLRSSGRRLPGVGALIASAIAVAIAGALAASAMIGGRAADSLDRFSDMQTDRPEMWEDGVHAARAYWPVGSGMGTFDEVFQLHESLEYVSPRRAGRAHSDWIEIAIEGGVFSLSLAFAWLAWCGAATVRRGPPEEVWIRLGAGFGIACVALQSVLDYPLRNQTLLCVAAVLVVLLIRPPEGSR